MASNPAQASRRRVDGVAAVVNEDIVTVSEVEERAAIEISRLRAENLASAERMEAARRHALDELIADRLLFAEQQKAHIEVSEQEIDLAIEDIRRQNNLDEVAFENALAAQGKSMEAFRAKMRRDLGAMKLIRRNAHSKIKLTEKDIEAEYAQQSKLQEADVEVHARHIVVQVPNDAGPQAEEEARNKALALARRARSGEDFAELAKKYSEGGSKESGGDVGFLRRGDMVEAFEQVAFNLAPGKISDPVRSPFGWHVIQVLETRKGEPQPLEQVRDELREKLLQKQMQRYTEQYVAELRQQAVVEIRIPKWKS
jgi:peptidyl-prolyl cis-trans isomerase SurA